MCRGGKGPRGALEGPEAPGMVPQGKGAASTHQVPVCHCPSGGACQCSLQLGALLQQPRMGGPSLRSIPAGGQQLWECCQASRSLSLNIPPKPWAHFAKEAGAGQLLGAHGHAGEDPDPSAPLLGREPWWGGTSPSTHLWPSQLNLLWCFLQGAQAEEVQAMLSAVPQAEKFAKFWICRAKLLAEGSPWDLAGLYRAAVCAGATVSVPCPAASSLPGTQGSAMGLSLVAQVTAHSPHRAAAASQGNASGWLQAGQCEGSATALPAEWAGMPGCSQTLLCCWVVSGLCCIHLCCALFPLQPLQELREVVLDMMKAADQTAEGNGGHWWAGWVG